VKVNKTRPQFSRINWHFWDHKTISLVTDSFCVGIKQWSCAYCITQYLHQVWCLL